MENEQLEIKPNSEQLVTNYAHQQKFRKHKRLQDLENQIKNREQDVPGYEDQGEEFISIFYNVCGFITILFQFFMWIQAFYAIAFEYLPKYLEKQQTLYILCTSIYATLIYLAFRSLFLGYFFNSKIEKYPQLYQKMQKISVRRIEKYCPPCKIQKNKEIHHCSTCNRCIVRLDHHCYFFGTCIGELNYRYFLSYIFITAILSIITILILHPQMKYLLYFKFDKIQGRIWRLITLYCMAWFFGFLTVTMNLSSIYYILNDVRLLEIKYQLKEPKYNVIKSILFLVFFGAFQENARQDFIKNWASIQQSKSIFRLFYPKFKSYDNLKFAEYVQQQIHKNLQILDYNQKDSNYYDEENEEQQLQNIQINQTPGGQTERINQITPGLPQMLSHQQSQRENLLANSNISFNIQNSQQNTQVSENSDHIKDSRNSTIITNENINNKNNNNISLSDDDIEEPEIYPEIQHDISDDEQNQHYNIKKLQDSGKSSSSGIEIQYEERSEKSSQGKIEEEEEKNIDFKIQKQEQKNKKQQFEQKQLEEQRQLEEDDNLDQDVDIEIIDSFQLNPMVGKLGQQKQHQSVLKEKDYKTSQINKNEDQQNDNEKEQYYSSDSSDYEVI